MGRPPFYIEEKRKTPLTDWQEEQYGAGDEARTRYLHLGKVALYRMSYTRIYRPTRLGQANGASGRNRTNDTRIFSPLLYLLSYRGIFFRCASGILPDSLGIISQETPFVNCFLQNCEKLSPLQQAVCGTAQRPFPIPALSVSLQSPASALYPPYKPSCRRTACHWSHPLHPKAGSK